MAAAHRRRVGLAIFESAPIGPGRALSRRAARAGGFTQVPHQVAGALEGLGFSYLLPTWAALSAKLYRLQREQSKHGGARPGDVKHALRTDRHTKTVERHLRLLDALGFLERGRVKGRPRRGPGTRVRYWLTHALGLQPTAAFADRDEARPSPAPPAPPEATRGPPEPTPAADPDGPRSGREALERLKAASRT